MDPDLDQSIDADDTERFALQTCPRCSALTPVALSLPGACPTCEACGQRLETEVRGLAAVTRP